MTVGQAFKTFAGAVLELGAASAQANAKTILEYMHAKATVHIAARVATVFHDSIPAVDVLGVDLASVVRSKTPVLQANLTQALDVQAEQLLALALAAVFKLGKGLQAP